MNKRAFVSGRKEVVQLYKMENDIDFAIGSRRTKRKQYELVEKFRHEEGLSAEEVLVSIYSEDGYLKMSVQKGSLGGRIYLTCSCGRTSADVEIRHFGLAKGSTSFVACESCWWDFLYDNHM